MPRTLLLTIIFLIVIALTALVFAFFFPPEKIETQRFSQCVLLQNPASGQIDCFGCVKDICKDAPAGWVIYQKPEIGIPYACFASETGCQLAQ